MKTAERLHALLKDPPLRICPDRPVAFFSDLHMGGGGPADNFAVNALAFRKALHTYRREGYLIVLLGDIYELWQFDENEIYGAYPDLYFEIELLKHRGTCLQLGGNHDRELKNPGALLIEGDDAPMLAVHGHQGDLLNDRWWKVGRWFTRYLWKPLEHLGVKDPTSASKSMKRHDLVRRQLSEWANNSRVILIAGHTHSQEQDGYYWNAGSGVTPGKIECIELDREMKLRTWT